MSNYRRAFSPERCRNTYFLVSRLPEKINGIYNIVRERILTVDRKPVMFAVVRVRRQECGIRLTDRGRWPVDKWRVCGSVSFPCFFFPPRKRRAVNYNASACIRDAPVSRLLLRSGLFPLGISSPDDFYYCPRSGRRVPRLKYIHVQPPPFSRVHSLPLLAVRRMRFSKRTGIIRPFTFGYKIGFVHTYRYMYTYKRNGGN